MRFDIDRICELAGLGAASGGLISEGAAPAPAKPAPAAAAKPGMKPAAKAPAAVPPVSEDDMADNMFGDDTVLSEDDLEEYMWTSPTEVGVGLDDGAVYEIDETDLMEALVDMRQQRLEETQVRDAVRDEIQRALSDKSSSWMYGGNKPTASRQGQIARGGFGFGFGFKR